MFIALSKLRTALNHKKSEVLIKNSKINIKVLQALLNNRLIVGFCIKNKLIKVYLKYDSFGNNVIKKLVIFSKPGKRIFIKKLLNKNRVKNKIYFYSTNNCGIVGTVKSISGEFLFCI